MTKTEYIGLGFILLMIANLGAWITHVAHTIANEEWIFLLAGAIFFPVAIVHGWLIWFGIA